MSQFMQNPKNLGARDIDIKEIFKFDCCGCGNCCRGRHNSIEGTAIFLSGPDIQRLSHFLNISCEQVIRQYTQITYDENMMLYVCKLKIKSTGVCVFLRKGKCSVYSARPKTCALYPLGMSTLLQGDEKNGYQFCGYQFVISPPETDYQCGRTTSYTVEEWLKENDISIDDDKDRDWYIKLANLSEKGKRIMFQDSSHNSLFNQLYLSTSQKRINVFE